MTEKMQIMKSNLTVIHIHVYMNREIYMTHVMFYHLGSE